MGLPGYTATWFNVSEADALSQGYITPYSRASYDEDFVEMVANMLMQGRVRFNEVVASVNPTAQQALRRKETMVVNYFREVWKIDFYSLQTRVQAALHNLITTPTVEEAFGFEKTYTVASVDPNNQVLLPQRASFMTMLNTAANAVAAIPDYGLTMDSMAVIAASATSSVVRIYLDAGTSVFAADFLYSQTVNNNVYDYTYVSANGNGDIIKTAVQPLLDYFSNNQFNITWYADPDASIFPRVKFTPVATPLNYFLAMLFEE